MRNIKLTIAYDGTNYFGFQKQPGTGLPTIQETLEKILSGQVERDVKIIGASRTDAGVHAQGQVINFDANGWNIPIGKIPLALNGLLPKDIVVKSADDVSVDFHARFCAKGKKYCYKIHNSWLPDPFLRRYSMFEPRSLDLEAVREAASYLEGTHDFSAFQAEGSPVKSAVRTLHRIKIQSKGSLIYLFFIGDGFLYNMIRILTGTLLDIGLHKYPPVQVMKILESGLRTNAGPTVPPWGLSLIEVYY